MAELTLVELCAGSAAVSLRWLARARMDAAQRGQMGLLP